MSKKSRPTSPSPIFFGCNFRHPLPPPPSQLQDPRIRDIASSSNIFENFKFSKMLDKDAISWIWGSCDCDGGKLDDKNCGWKNRKCRLIFSVRFSSHNQPHTPPPHRNHRRTLNGWQKSRRKNWKCRFDFLSAIFITQPPYTSPPPLQSAQDPQWMTKMAQKKSKRLIFSARFLSPNYLHTHTPHHNHTRTLDGWWKSHRKNWKRRFDFFSCDFHPPSLSQSPQDPRIRNIESSNIFENLLMAISTRDCNGRGWDENRGQKNRKRLQDVAKTFKVWKRQVARPSRQTSSRSA